MAMCRLRSRRAPVCRAATVGGLPHRIDTAFGQCARSQGRGRAKLGGQIVEKGEEFWRKLREHELGFFAGGTPPLWRLSVPPATASLELPGMWLYDWGGAQRWLRSSAPPGAIFRAAEQAAGHATLFRGGDRSGQRLSAAASSARGHAPPPQAGARPCRGPQLREDRLQTCPGELTVCRKTPSLAFLSSLGRRRHQAARFSMSCYKEEIFY